MWSEMPIGKYKGKTLPQLLLTDPDYFFWAMKQDDFFRGGLAKQASDILRKVRRIKIPKPDPANWRVEYFLTPDGKFAHFDIVEADRVHRTSGRAERPARRRSISHMSARRGTTTSSDTSTSSRASNTSISGARTCG